MKKFLDPELYIDRFDEDIICDSGSLTGDEGDDDSGTVGPNSVHNDT